MRQRALNPADLVKHYTDLINEERVRLEECLSNIAHHAEQLRRVAEETGQRLIARD